MEEGIKNPFFMYYPDFILCVLIFSSKLDRYPVIFSEAGNKNFQAASENLDTLNPKYLFNFVELFV